MRLLSRNSGFTLIEMLISIVIASILLALAVPSFKDLILTQRVKAGVSGIQSALFFARSEALKRRMDVIVIPAGGDWKSGWTVCVDNDADSVCDAPPGVLRFEDPLNSQLASMAGATVRYQQTGRVAAAPAAIKTYVTGNTRVVKRCVVVDLSGRPSVIDHNSDPTNCP